MTSPDGIVKDFLPGFCKTIKTIQRFKHETFSGILKDFESKPNSTRLQIGQFRGVRLQQHCQVLRSSANKASFHHHRRGQVYYLPDILLGPLDHVLDPRVGWVFGQVGRRGHGWGRS